MKKDAAKSRKSDCGMHQPPRDAQREWFDLKALTRYSGLSRRTLWSWIRDQADPLPASKVRGKWLVRRRDFDSYVERHRAKPVPVGGAATMVSCKYDWAPGFRGRRLRCVAAHRHKDSTIVVVRGDGETLKELFTRDQLTGEALLEAQAAGRTQNAQFKPRDGER